jgi:hypothetical protein
MQGHCPLLRFTPSSFHSIAVGLSWSCAASGRRCPARYPSTASPSLFRFAHLHFITQFRSGRFALPNTHHLFPGCTSTSLHCSIPFRRFAPCTLQAMQCPAGLLLVHVRHLLGHRRLLPAQVSDKSSLAKAALSHMH